MLESRLWSVPREFSRRHLMLAGLAAALPVSLLLEGCKKSLPGSASGISQELQQSWPIWSHEDLEVNKNPGAAVQYAHEMNLKPDFYRGSMPLKFKSSHNLGSMVGLGGMSGPKICYRHEFDVHTNYFVYDSFWLKGAVAVDKTNTLVAEAKFDYVRGGEEVMMVPTIEEFHYAGGRLVFHCMSELDNSTGMKTKEMQKSGRKQRDYFFIMPIGMNE